MLKLLPIGIALAIICNTITIIESSTVEQQACAGAPAVGHFFVPSPLSCNHYILCMNGVGIHTANCPAGRHINIRDQNCGLIGTVDCAQCAPFGFVNIAHTTNCNQFFECSFGVRTVRTCSANLYFDPALGNCNLATLVQCPGGGGGIVTPPPPPPPTTVQPPPVTPPGPDPVLPVCIPGGQVHHGHPTDCRRYFMCINGILWEHICPSELHWNERAMACDKPQNAQCFRQLANDEQNDVEDIPQNEF